MTPSILIFVFTLLVVYQLKHFFADYWLQGNYMLGKFKDDWGFVLPLLAHVAIHGLFTLLICLMVKPELWWLFIVDITIHFCMDRIKAGKKYLGRFKTLSGNEYVEIKERIDTLKMYSIEVPKAGHQTSEETKQYRLEISQEIKEEENKFYNNTYFWWSLGFDQMVHHLTHYYIIYRLVNGG